ncbi:MAG: hypothetical protein ACR2RL_21325 [Gammaproteobacteria bacterium]
MRFHVDYHMNDSIIEGGGVALAAFRLGARLGNMDYTYLDRAFTLPRPRKSARAPL